MHVLENIREAVGNAIGDEDPDGDQGQQLDDGLERDGGDDPVVAFVGIQVSRSEQDGEQGHAGGDPERRRDGVGVAGDDLVTARHGLQLKRDIGCHRDDRDQGDEDGQA